MSFGHYSYTIERYTIVLKKSPIVREALRPKKTDSYIKLTEGHVKFVNIGCQEVIRNPLYDCFDNALFCLVPFPEPSC